MDKRKRLGKDSPFWRGGKPKCKTCGKQLSRYGAEYCTHHRDRSGKNNGTWKGGKPCCPVCHKQLTHYDRKYCLKHVPNTFQSSPEGRKMVSDMMKGNQYRKGLLGNGWKGDKAGNRVIHHWMNWHFGRPTKCEICGKDGLIGRQIHWANKEHKYLRQRDNWLRLCPKCHWAYDKSKGLR